MESLSQALLKFFLIALIARLAVLAISFSITPFSLQDLMDHSDTPSYVAVANYFQGEPVSLSDWDKRIFPGWSYVLALFGGIDLRLASVALSILLAAAVGPVFYLITKDKEATWWLAFFSPAFLFNSLLGMSESCFLFCQLAGFYCHLNKRHAWSGILMGMAGVVRPTALFLYLPMLIENYKSLDQKRLAGFILLSAIFPLAMLAINHSIFGDLFLQLHQYQGLPNISVAQRTALSLAENDGSHFGLPGKNLLLASLYTQPPLWKQCYIWGHVLVLFLSIYTALRGKNPGPLDFTFKWWAIGNALFILSTGEYWAFHSFDRYFVWALPAYLYFIMPYLRALKLPVAIPIVGCTVVTIVGVLKFL